MTDATDGRPQNALCLRIKPANVQAIGKISKGLFKSKPNLIFR
jgi:hypothetical protein